MNESLGPPTIVGLIILALGGSLLGLTALFEGSKSRRLLSWTNLFAVLFVIGAGAALVVQQPLATWGAALLVGTVPLLTFGLRVGQPLLLRVLTALLSRPRLQAVLLLVAGPLLAVGWTFHAEYASWQSTPPIPGMRLIMYPPLLPVEVHACTDEGRPLPLWTLGTTDDDVAAIMSGPEENTSRQLPMKILRTAPPSIETNCHGWVFCDGRYCIHNQNVEQILQENGYEIVANPQPDDVIIYRDDQGGIIHSGLVRTVYDDTVLIESKWGILGRYLHAPTDQTYSTHWNFYRSARSGHSVRIEPGQLTE
jgi:hypothetical protein